jgi:hypothetical protein
MKPKPDRGARRTPMQGIYRTAKAQWIGVLALFVALGGVTTAASGGFARLGGTNTEDRPMLIENTGSGPALTLKAQQGQPPLAVDSPVQVSRLNASLLEGKRAGDFAPRSGSPNYQSVEGHQLLMAAQLGGFEFDPRVFYRRTLRAPADGSMYITLIGECTVNDRNVARLGVFLNGSGHSGPWGKGLTTPSPVRIGCSESSLYQVSKGDRVVASVSFTRDKGTPHVYSVFLQVVFDPTDLGH